MSGDWRGELSPYPALSNADDRGLKFFVSLGDTIYADYPSPALPKPQAENLADYRIKHQEVYSERFGQNTLADLRRSVSIFAMIDDHEVINDFAGGAPPSSDLRFDQTGEFINQTTLYRSGLQAFFEYNPIRATYYQLPRQPRFHRAPDLYRDQIYGKDAALFILDARSFRDQELPGVQNPLDPAQVAAYLARSFNVDPVTGNLLPPRTLLGLPQILRLKIGLLAAKHLGVTWKFICVPEPIQNLGVIGASDRFEGYAAERAELLAFIEEHQISNVVFIAADVHGTLVNNLTYQQLPEIGPQFPQKPTTAFEITTGAVAFDAPFGPTVFNIAASVLVAPGVSLLDVFLQRLSLQLGFPVPNRQAFDLLPRPVKDTALVSLIDQQLAPLGYDPVGLQGSSINATLIQGGYTSLFTFGWTEFEIDPATQKLVVTTWGIEPYTAAEIDATLPLRQPAIVSQFAVTPAP